MGPAPLKPGGYALIYYIKIFHKKRSKMQSQITEERISKVLIKAIQNQTIINEEDTALIFYDLSYLNERINSIIKLFPKTTLHAIAIKANPLLKILEKIKQLSIGLEAATLPELYLAEKSGLKTNKIVFDSPTKTRSEIEYAINLGCHINIDSLNELTRIANLLDKKIIKSTCTFGIRINPQVGTGTIALTSVAGEYSKFGVPINEYRQELINSFIKYDWLTGVHLHIGSQGCPVDMLLKGVETVYNFTIEVNQLLMNYNSEQKIKIFDIGGGFPVSYCNNTEAPSLLKYVQELRIRFPDLFTDKFKLITEFGRYIHANTGWVASKVEYVKRDKNINTAMVHVGADLFLRRCYRPEDWHHDIFVLDKNGKIKTGKDDKNYIIAGPLCFAGDMIAKNVELPKVEENDYLIIKDTGAYTLSMWSRYNSRQIPKVIGYYQDGYEFITLRDRESLEKIFEFWY